MKISRFFSKLLQAPKVPEVPMEMLPRASVVRVKTIQPVEPVWLTKKLNDIDICSRNQASRFLEAGMIKVDGRTAWDNIRVHESSKIEISRRKDTNSEKLPIPEETKIWIFYKPPNFTSTLVDPYRRPTIYHYLDSTKFPRITVYTIGHLDYHSEGLMLLTNNKDLSESAEFAQSLLKRQYKVRVNGQVKSRIIEEIRRGMVCSAHKYKPMYVWVSKKSQKSKNVWVNAVLTKAHPRELRGVFVRRKMPVNRLVRTAYGPYKLKGLKPGEFQETQIHIILHKLLFKFYKQKAEKQ